MPGVPLDDLGLPDAGPVFLKIDTQGHDWEVISGAGGIFKSVVLLSMELSFAGFYESSVPAWESLARLSDLGFVLAHLDAVCPGPNPMQIGEADGLFVRAR